MTIKYPLFDDTIEEELETLSYYCCEKCKKDIQDNLLETCYLAEFRRYAILLRGSSGCGQILFCPWCGKKMPGTLHDMWHKEVAALGFSDDDCYEIGKLPHKYCTKQWWVEKLQKGEILEEDPFPYEIVSIDSCNTKGCDSVQTLSQHLDSNETMSAHVDYLSLLYKSPPHHTFCCSLMEEEVNDRNPFICYLPYVREYGIAKRHVVDEMELIYYCPWCGKKLPISLREEWNRQRWNPARKDISIDDPYDEELLSDKWWIIREAD